jgi:hypothetical protein
MDFDDIPQETGYRLCSTNFDTDTSKIKIFLAQWDPNNSNQIFICHQNGTLQVLNKETNNSSYFHTFFRPFSANFTENAKKIELHFDKFIALPNRPNEVIFLLGVSPTLYHTTLPAEYNFYPKENVMVQSSSSLVLNTTVNNVLSGNYQQYIYGNPVLNANNHQSRITALAAMSNGDIIASGDERGTFH